MMPWALTDYFAWTRSPDLGDFHLTMAAAPAETTNQFV
jgi:hypothetical protein